MSSINYYHLNGAIVPEQETKLHVSDLALLRGFGIFDFFLVIRTVPLFVEDYVRRFFHSAEKMGMNVPYSKDQVIQYIKELIAANKMEDGAIRLLMTGGYAADGYTPQQPNFVILAHKYPSYPDEVYQNGAALISQDFQRFLPEVKTTQYANSILLQPKIKAAGAVDVLYHHDGYISETARSSFFIVNKEGKVVTAPTGVLPGISMLKILPIAREQFEVEERPIALEELKEAREVFITGSTKRVMPIVKIDDLIIGDGRPGPVTRSLMKSFLELTRDYVENALAVRR